MSARQLKWLAWITMTIDHIGYFQYPSAIWLRMIGRLSFPLFAFLVCEGYRHTANKKQYFIRMAGSAALTQLLFTFAQVGFVNVMVTFSFAIAAMYCYDRKWHLGIAGIIYLTTLINPDYSYYGVTLILLYYIFQERRGYQIASLAITTILFTMQYVLIEPEYFMLILRHFAVYYFNFIQLLAIFSGIFLYFYNGSKGKKFRHPWLAIVEKYFFYIYYPLHILLLKLW